MAVPERSFGDSETPIRVFRYPDGGWRKVAADFAAAIGLTFVCGSFAMDGPSFDSIHPHGAILALVGCYASISSRLRKRRHIRLYHDRIAWDTLRGIRTIKLKDLGPSKTCTGDQGRGIVFQTPQGNLILPERMDGFGELARRIEEAKYGWIDRALPPSTTKWTGPDVFRYRGFLPGYTACKIAGAAIALAGATMVSSPIDFLVFFVVAAAFVGLAMLDARQYQNARIERIGNRLVQFDRWNHPVASVDIATLHHITTHETGHRAEGRLYGDDGVIIFGSNLENSLALVEAAYSVLAGRYRSERSRTSENLLPVQVRH